MPKEKIKKWKKALREYDQLTEQDVVSPVEEKSMELLDNLEKTQPTLQSLYEDLAQAQDPELFGADVMHRLRSYRRTSANLTRALTVFFVFDCVVTLITVFRWSQRVEGIAASNASWAFIDTRFPNARMQKIFANMVFR